MFILGRYILGRPYIRAYPEDVVYPHAAGQLGGGALRAAAVDGVAEAPGEAREHVEQRRAHGRSADRVGLGASGGTTRLKPPFSLLSMEDRRIKSFGTRGSMLEEKDFPDKAQQTCQI